MGHHTIKEVSQEKFEFQGRTKLIPILLIVLGAVMAGIGSMQVKNNWNAEDAHATEADLGVNAARLAALRAGLES